ncbi:MAG: multifunctional oxoglutarate decarboxylase/oxoglutarate dehydrogenase thiamine pyrophosphate-binding subunit/dihydrolipoyllysine-residue succinyltransferase subunit, partial [Acidimicrobiales bacterium]
MAETPNSTEVLGPNAWLVDEMYEQYLADPGSVSESWRDFFADYQRDRDVVASTPDAALPATGRVGDTSQIPAVGVGAAKAPTAGGATPSTGIAADGTVETPGEPLRGAAARIVTNMEASLAVPTATSFREVPAKL